MGGKHGKEHTLSQASCTKNWGRKLLTSMREKESAGCRLVQRHMLSAMVDIIDLASKTLEQTAIFEGPQQDSRVPAATR
jgi:hypothetical protein